jgi:hypothetical protein
MKKQIISEEFKRMQVLAGLITELQLNEEIIDATNSDQYGNFLQNKTKELVGKKVKLNIFDTFANNDKEEQKFTGNIVVDLKKRTGGTGNLTFDAVLIDDGGYNYITPFKNKEIKITMPSTTGGQGGFNSPIGEGPRGLFKVKTIEIM